MIKLKNLLNESFDTSKPFSTTDPASNGTLINPGNDPWQYVQKNGAWLTRKKKGSASWINMKKALSPENYAKAVSVLQKYIDARNKAEGGSSNFKTVNKVNEPTVNKFDIDYANTEMKTMLDQVNSRRHPEVTVLGQSTDGQYLQIQNPRRLAIHREVYVDAADFKIDPSGEIATYVGSEPKYNIYKLK